MIRVLVDESVEQSIIELLRSIGIDVLAASEWFPSVTDDVVLARAVIENRIILTNDKDFGYMIYRQKRKHKGVILLRFITQKTVEKVTYLKTVLSEFPLQMFRNKFGVISEKGVRIRPEILN